MIVEELNEAYSTFMARHPDFNGKVSIYALSLGGVAMYDILTCMDDDEPEKGLVDNHPVSNSNQSDTAADTDEKARVSTSTSKKHPSNKTTSPPEQSGTSMKAPRVRKQDQSKFRAVVPKLKFRPNFLFTVGSPVGW